jgi:hypothetical protein
MRNPDFSRRFLPRFAAGLALACMISGCSVIGMLPGGYRLFPPEYYFAYDIRLDPDTSGAGTLCKEGTACFEERGVALSWRLDQDGARFEIRNGTGSPLRILWPQASILEDEVTRPVVASIGYRDQGVEHQLNRRLVPPPPTVLAPGAITSFDVLPSSRAAWQEITGARDNRGFWTAETPLWGLAPDESKKVEEMRQQARRAVGRHVQIEVPLEIGGVRRDWLFDLAVTDAHVRRVNW